MRVYTLRDSHPEYPSSVPKNLGLLLNGARTGVQVEIDRRIMMTV